MVITGLGFAQRQPLWLLWEDGKDKEQQGVTISANVLAIVHGAVNIILDVWMLILPLTQLYNIGLKPRKKLGVLAMFSVSACCKSNQ